MTTTTQRDSREAQSIKTENLAGELRELADSLVAKAQELFESTCHPALGDFSGELQQTANELRAAVRHARDRAESCDRLAHDEYLALSIKLANERRTA
jgi:hypothetical protein